MEKSSSTSSSERPLWIDVGLVVGGVLALIVLAEPFFSWFAAKYIKNTEYQLFRYQLERAAEPPPADLVFLGDSVLRSSVVPSIIEAATGASALNLGLVANAGAMSDYYVFAKYLEHHAAPKAVVVIHSLHAWPEDFHRELFALHFATPVEAVRVWSAGLVGPLDAVDFELQCALGSYRYRQYLKTSLLSSVFVGLDYYPAVAAEVEAFHRARRELGYYPDESKGNLPAEGWSVDPSYARPFKLSSSNAYYLDRLLGLAEERKVPVYFTDGPLYAPDAARMASAPMVRGLREELSRRRANSLIGGNEIFPLEAEETSGTWNHPSPAGAKRFSAHLGEALKTVLRERTEPQ